jgi:hypothetical protein
MDLSGPVPQSFQTPLLVLAAICIVVGSAQIGIGAVVYAQFNETTNFAFGAWWGAIAVVVSSGASESVYLYQTHTTLMNLFFYISPPNV